MRKIALYNTARPIIGKSFKHCKCVVVPNQSMTLRDILIRFTRREALPVEKEGSYTEGYGDLEKLARKDITEQLEVAEDLGRKVKAYRDNSKPKPPPQPTPPTPTPGLDPLNPSGEPKP